MIIIRVKFSFELQELPFYTLLRIEANKYVWFRWFFGLYGFELYQLHYIFFQKPVTMIFWLSLKITFFTKKML